MNKITLKNAIIKNIQPSHTVNNIEYEKADLIVKRDDGKEDLIDIRFKKFSNKYQENDKIDLVGNIRSYSKKVSENKNSVDLYVFTYFDSPENKVEEEGKGNNIVEVDGRICKISPLKITSEDKAYIHFILANNIIAPKSAKRINSYIPTIAWGDTAKFISTLAVSDKVSIIGELQSREYKKRIGEGEDDFEIRVAKELVVKEIKKIED